MSKQYFSLRLGALARKKVHAKRQRCKFLGKKAKQLSKQYFSLRLGALARKNATQSRRGAKEGRSFISAIARKNMNN